MSTLSGRQRILIIVGAVVVALILIAGMFIIGLRVGQANSAAKSSPTPTATKTSTATATAKPEPVKPGTYAWNQLHGGECLAKFSNPWAEKFTVVDCTKKHNAQLVAVGTFPDAPAVYPGEDALAAQVNLLCTAPGVLDLGAAGAITGLQVQASYAVTEKQWSAGDHNYNCFVSVPTGELTASLIPAS